MAGCNQPIMNLSSKLAEAEMPLWQNKTIPYGIDRVRTSKALA